MRAGGRLRYPGTGRRWGRSLLETAVRVCLLAGAPSAAQSAAAQEAAEADRGSAPVAEPGSGVMLQVRLWEGSDDAESPVSGARVRFVAGDHPPERDAVLDAQDRRAGHDLDSHEPCPDPP